ncbi:hypothetical protein CKAH01_16766 [Colletotrichum kahawae]|uniref:Uncharacterized protein n=1 Tax=Colletotrichum kahawae TaxID=34407 RepID=A0AAE0D516_COLKA|nr:hypothetical protein CKAH01_16766 [Colletotrichum kahawae]
MGVKFDLIALTAALIRLLILYIYALRTRYTCFSCQYIRHISFSHMISWFLGPLRQHIRRSLDY